MGTSKSCQPAVTRWPECWSIATSQNTALLVAGKWLADSVPRLLLSPLCTFSSSAFAAFRAAFSFLSRVIWLSAASSCAALRFRSAVSCGWISRGWVGCKGGQRCVAGASLARRARPRPALRAFGVEWRCRTGPRRVARAGPKGGNRNRANRVGEGSPSRMGLRGPRGIPPPSSPAWERKQQEGRGAKVFQLTWESFCYPLLLPVARQSLLKLRLQRCSGPGAQEAELCCCACCWLELTGSARTARNFNRKMRVMATRLLVTVPRAMAGLARSQQTAAAAAAGPAAVQQMPAEHARPVARGIVFGAMRCSVASGLSAGCGRATRASSLAAHLLRPATPCTPATLQICRHGRHAHKSCD